MARLAVQYELKLTIPARGDLTQILRDANIDGEDSVAADRLAVTARADGARSCLAKISVTKAVTGGGFRLVRVLLIMSDGRQTVIERRGAELTVASKTPARKSLRLV